MAAFAYCVCMALVMWLGVLVYAYYSDCEPVMAGRVDKYDQVNMGRRDL